MRGEKMIVLLDGLGVHNVLHKNTKMMFRRYRVDILG